MRLQTERSCHRRRRRRSSMAAKTRAIFAGAASRRRRGNGFQHCPHPFPPPCPPQRWRTCLSVRGPVEGRQEASCTHFVVRGDNRRLGGPSAFTPRVTTVSRAAPFANPRAPQAPHRPRDRVGAGPTCLAGQNACPPETLAEPAATWSSSGSSRHCAIRCMRSTSPCGAGVAGASIPPASTSMTSTLQSGGCAFEAVKMISRDAYSWPARQRISKRALCGF